MWGRASIGDKAEVVYNYATRWRIVHAHDMICSASDSSVAQNVRRQDEDLTRQWNQELDEVEPECQAAAYQVEDLFDS